MTEDSPHDSASVPGCYEWPDYTVRLLAPVPDRLAAMKAIRALWPDINLAQAKSLVDAAPTVLKTDVNHLSLEDVRRAFRYADAEVEFTDNAYGHKR